MLTYMTKSQIYLEGISYSGSYTGCCNNYTTQLESQCLRIKQYSDIPSIIIIGREEHINTF